MPQATLKQQAGLFTSPNPFVVPPTGLAVADNCIIREAGILESRRGLALQAALSGGSRVTSFQATPVGLAGTVLNHFNGGAWVPYAGTFVAPDNALMRFLVSAEALYFTTRDGLQKLDDISGTAKAVGVLQAFAPDGGFINQSVTNAWMATNAAVAYRVTFATLDAQGDYIEGAPSPRFIVANTTGSTGTVNLTFVFPTWFATTYVMYIYRSVQSASATAVPSDELFLCAKRSISSADISAHGLTFTDTLPDGALGAALYTNASQQGIAEENDTPPLGKDICLFKSTTLLFNVVDKQRAQATTFQIPTNNSVVGDQFLILSGATTNTYRGGATENTSTNTYQRYTGNSHGENDRYIASDAELTLRSLARCINATNTVGVFAQCISSGTRTTNAAAILAISSVSLTGAAFSLLSVGYAPTAFSTPSGAPPNGLTRATNVVTVSQIAHPWSVGNQVKIQVSPADPNFPDGTKVVATVSTNSWTYAETGSNATSSGAAIINSTHDISQTWPDTAGVQVASDNSSEPGGFRASKLNQPDAWPLENDFSVGDVTQAILRGIPLRDSVLIFKQDGLYRLTGDDPSSFSIQPYDLTFKLVWPEAAAAITDNVLCMTDKGPMGVGESTGAFVLAQEGADCPIRESLLALLANCPSATTTAFGVAYESERLYILWTPAQNTDTKATQAWAFNTAQAAWTRWPVPAAHCIVDPPTNKLLLVDGTNSLLERKDFADTDYQDTGGTANITAVTDSTHITMSGPGVGDLITQGGNSARVLVAAGSALTLDTAGSWSLASATYARAILCKPTYLPWAGGEENPGAVHQFQELAFTFRTFTGSWVNVTTATDMDPSEEKVLIYGRASRPGNVNFRAGFSRNKGSGMMLSAGLEIAQAVASWQLQSTALLYRPISTRTPAQHAP